MNKLRIVLAVLFGAALFGFFAYATGQGVLRDWRMRNMTTIQVGSEVLNGRCSVYLFAINFCDFTLRTARTHSDEMLIFIDFNAPGEGYDIVARAAADNPELVTTTLALDMFWNRVITLAAFLGLFGFAVVAGLRQLFQPPRPAPSQAAPEPTG